MPNEFVPMYARDNQTRYYYADKVEITVVQPHAKTDWPLRDTKGRAVGFGWNIVRQVTTLEEGEHDPRNNRLHKVGEPLDVFIARGCQTRNGERYGSGDITVQGTDIDQVRLEMAKRIERARVMATKKHAPTA